MKRPQQKPEQQNQELSTTHATSEDADHTIMSMHWNPRLPSRSECAPVAKAKTAGESLGLLPLSPVGQPCTHYGAHSLSAQQMPRPNCDVPGASPLHDVACAPPASDSSLDHVCELDVAQPIWRAAAYPPEYSSRRLHRW